MVRSWAGCLVVASALVALVGCRDKAERADLERGGQAFLAQCAVCHGPYGLGDGPLAATITAEGKVPPAALDGALVARLGRDGVRRALEARAHLAPGSPMPAWGPLLGAEWTERVADYVVAAPATGEAGRAAVTRYLAAPAGTPRDGRRVYVLYCSGCHGPRGEGDGFFSPSLESGLEASPLRGNALLVLDDAELSRFIGLGGAHAPKAVTMPGWLYTLSPEERTALAGYLRALPGPAAER